MSRDAFDVPDLPLGHELSELLDPTRFAGMCQRAGLSAATPSTVRVDYIRPKTSGILVGARIESPDDEALFSMMLQSRAEHDRERIAEPGACTVVPLSPEAEVELRLFPTDRRLRALPSVVDLRHLRRRLTHDDSLIDGRWRLRKRHTTLHVLRYKPERRAVVCVVAGLADDARHEREVRMFFVRCARPQDVDVAQVTRVLRHAAAAGLECPRPLAAFDDGVRIEARLEGTPITELDALDPSTARSAGQWLARLHGLTANGGPSEEQDLLPRLTLAANAISQLDRAAGDVAHSLAGALSESMPEVHVRRLHGDFHPRQLVRCGDTVGVLDFDRTCLGSAAYDLGVFHAHAREELDEPTANRLILAVEQGYAELAELPNDPEMRWFRAATLLLQADSGFRQGRPNWKQRMATMLQAAETALDAGRV